MNDGFGLDSRPASPTRQLSRNMKESPFRNNVFLPARHRDLATLVLSLSSLVSMGLQAQTTLSAGDVSFIAAESDTNGAIADGYIVVPWVTLAAGTVLKFTDNGMSNANGTAANTTEHAWTFTVGASGITAGTILNFGYDSPTTGRWNGPASGTTSANLVNFTNAGLSTSGDQLFIYQGSGTTANIATSPAGAGAFTGTLVAGINFGVTATTGNPDANSTYAPTSLVNANAYVNGGNLDNGYYNGVRTGFTNTLFRSATGNTSNFTFVDTVNASYNRSTNFTVASAASIHWDANGTAVNNGGTGTWDTGTNNLFKDSASGTTYTRWVNSSSGNSHTAVFGGTAGTVSMGASGATADGLQFTVNGYTIQNNTVTLVDSDGAGSATPTIDVVTSGHTATVNANIAGNAGFTKSGAGNLVLGANNAYTGGTRITGGVLQIGSSGTTGSLGSGAVANGGSLVFNRSNNFNVANGISGTGTLAKRGGGTMTLLGINNYSGDTAVENGTLVVDGSAPNSRITVSSGAALRGDGTVGALVATSGSTIGAAGDGDTGVFSTGSIDLRSGSTLDMELNGATAGTGHDQLSVTGTVSLAGALAISLNFTPVNGDLLFLLINDGNDGISGTFQGLANNSIFTLGDQEFRISYFANSGTDQMTGGNDLAVMAIPEPQTALLFGGVGMLLLFRRREQR